MIGRIVRPALYLLCLILAPACLAAIDLFHPADFTAHPGMYQFLAHAEHGEMQFEALAYFGPGWWFTLHMIQTPQVGLVAIGLWFMSDLADSETDRIASACAWLAGLATFLFLIYYTVLDAVCGIGLGRAIVTIEQLASQGILSPAQVEGAALLLNYVWTDGWVGGVGSAMSETGSWAVFAASLLIACALFRSQKAGWITAGLLIAFGWELQTSHASPHGPAAFALLIGASISLWWRMRHRVARGAGTATG
jgi:hypothetical protein